MLKLQTWLEGRVSVPGALSSRSTSWTKVAKTVAVQVSPAWKFVFGMMTQEFPAPAATVASLDAGRDAGNVVPVWIDGHRLGEGDDDAAVARHDGRARNRVGTGGGRSKLSD